MAGPVLDREPGAAARDRRRRSPRRGRRSCAAARSSRGPARTRFQGLGVEGLRYLAEARERTGLPVITEVMEPNQVDVVAEYADILQVGTRNMQNFSLLTAVGRVGPAGDAQARLRRHDRGVADVRRVHRQLRQPQRDPVRAGHPDVRDLHPQHARPDRRAAPPPPDPPAGDRRPVARHRQALAGQADGAGRRRGRRRRDHGRGPSTTRTRPCPTASSRSPWPSSRT